MQHTFSFNENTGSNPVLTTKNKIMTNIFNIATLILLVINSVMAFATHNVFAGLGWFMAAGYLTLYIITKNKTQ